MKNKTMTIEEAKKMEGTEFIYVYPDGDEVRSYVKKFDSKIGLTCMSLESQTRDGWVNKYRKNIEKDGTYCVIAYNFKSESVKYRKNEKRKALRVLQEIKNTGKYKVKVKIKYGGIFENSPSCAFM